MISLCPYCRSNILTLRAPRQFHKVDKTFGPFDLVRCDACGSLATAEPPTVERLARFYENYEEHRPDWYSLAARDSALDPQYDFYAKFVSSEAPPGAASWVDVGAGHGEVACRLAKTHPNTNGFAIDIGRRPASLPEAIGYTSADLNAPSWSQHIGRTFDLVYAIAVWEHVLDPRSFARECAALLAPGGALVLVTPDYGSLASQFLGRLWPYYEPGEHVTIPTRAGASICLQACAQDAGLDASAVTVRRLDVSYSIRYVLEVLQLNPIARLVPPGLCAALPTGILAGILRAPMAVSALSR